MLKLDTRDFERMAASLGAFERQIPFAIATALNAAAFEVKDSLSTETWERYVQVRNRNALRSALRVEKAQKNSLRVAVVGSGPSAERLNLAAHAHGGNRAHRGRRIAIAPTGTVRRGARGVPKGMQPRAVIASTPKRALRVTDKGIFVGSGGKLHRKYTFASEAHIKADVPFDSDFERLMRDEVQRQFPRAIQNAMKTAFRK